MVKIPDDLGQIPVVAVSRLGARTQQRSVSWRQVMPFLGYRLIAVGLTDARAGFAFARPPGSMSAVMVALSGAGVVRLAGRWVPWPAGTAVRMPAQADAAYCHTAGTWRLAWLCWRDDGVAESVVPGSICTAFTTDGRALAQAIDLLISERQGVAETATVHHAAALVELLGRRLVYGAHDAHSWGSSNNPARSRHDGFEGVE